MRTIKKTTIGSKNPGVRENDFLSGYFHRKIIALSMAHGVGSRTIIRSINEGSGKSIPVNNKAADEELRMLPQKGVKAVSFWDKEYPAILKDIYSPPAILFVKGALAAEDKKSVAIVGSRRCTAYGYRTAGRLAFDLAKRGVTIVSGLANGIDEAAHLGALKAGGRTIAVMGSGFKHLYPRGREKLVDEIAANGAVITEYTMDTLPSRYNFPQRNRIISGLSKGVVVVEAKRRSGALITSDHALNEGRDVMAVPGNIDSVNSEGANKLIKDGAVPVSSAEEILFEIGECGFEKAPAGKVTRKGLSDEQRMILDVLAGGSRTHIDDISESTNIGPGGLSIILLEMELNDMIKSLPGSVYTLA